MMEQIKQETFDRLVSLFYPNVEAHQDTQTVEQRSIHRKECLYFLQLEGKKVKDFSEELLDEYRLAYHEIEKMSDQEFEHLKAEILTAKVIDLPS